MLKNALKMLYLIAHFQKNFTGEDPRTPRCQGKEIKLENRGVGKEIKLLGTLYTPAYGKPYYELFQHASMSGCISTSQEVYVDFLVQAMSRCVQKF